MSQTKKAVMYLRVSSEGQAIDGTSFETQELECREYAGKQGYVIGADERDTETGVDSSGYRPGLRRVRNILQRGEAEVLLIWKLDRLSRGGPADNFLLHSEAVQAGALLDSVHEGPLPDDQPSRMKLYMAGEIGLAERNAIILRTRGGIQRRIEDGMPLVGKYQLFGYRYIYGPGKRVGTQRKIGYEVNSDTAPVVLRCYREVDSGRSLRQVARGLNVEGVPTPSMYLASQGLLKEGTKPVTEWSRQMVSNLLRNPSYTGNHVAYRRKYGKQQVRDERGMPKPDEKPRVTMAMRDGDDPKLVATPIPAIVPQDLWDRVQALLKVHQEEASRHNPDPEATLLRRGIAICGHCGATMDTMKHPDRTYRTYVCRHRRTMVLGGGESCPGGVFHLRADDVDADVWAKVSEVARNTDKVQRLLETRRATSERSLENAKREADILEAEIAEVSASVTRAERRMKAADDDAEYGMWKEQWRRDNALLATLEQRQQKSNAAVTHRYAYLARVQLLVHRTMNLIAGRPVDEVLPPNHVMKQALDHLADTSMGQFKEAWQTLANDYDPLASLSYHDKREIMRLLGVQVKMYATDSDHYRQTGVRWDVSFTADKADGDDCVSFHSQKLTQNRSTFTWADWLAVA